MRLQLEKLGKIAHIDDDKGYVVAVLLALIIVSVSIAGYFTYAAYFLKPEAYNSIYLLDTQNKAVDYPQTLTVNQQFKVYVGVANHWGSTENYTVEIKITKNLSTYPIDTQPSQTYTINNLPNGATNQTEVTISPIEIGNYWVVFELWQENNGILEFTHNFCVLNIQVTSH
ncbi:MAG: DUF1616 domain-containing protein [Candidatus Bathyarchaeota archaeon]|nr:DUF1616 domain-containing protein [Candidatus Bathyarchaeota archaeon]